MGSVTEAAIQHKLSSKEIFSLRELFNETDFIDTKELKWAWTASNINPTFLETYWKTTWEDQIKKGSWGIEDMALLENGDFSLHFHQPNLVSFSTGLKSTIYNYNPVIKTEFDLMAKQIALLMNATDIIIIEDWHYGEAFDVDDKLTVEIIREGVMKRNFRFCEIDLHA
jgi:hypothetical protein